MNEEMIEVDINRLDPAECASCRVRPASDYTIAISDYVVAGGVRLASYECRRCGAVWTVVGIAHAAS